MSTITLKWNHKGLEFRGLVDYQPAEPQTREYPGCDAEICDLSDVEILNPKTNTWEKVPDLLTAEEWFWAELEDTLNEAVSDHFAAQDAEYEREWDEE